MRYRLSAVAATCGAVPTVCAVVLCVCGVLLGGERERHRCRWDGIAAGRWRHRCRDRRHHGLVASLPGEVCVLLTERACLLAGSACLLG
eukprot:5715637-Prymnesium_polylepis.5